MTNDSDFYQGIELTSQSKKTQTTNSKYQASQVNMQLSVKTILGNYHKFPIVLLSLTIAYIYIYLSCNNDRFAYNCDNDMFYSRLFTYHFNHIDNTHIGYNIFGLWLFGLYICFRFADIVNILPYFVGIISAGATFYSDCKNTHSSNRVVGASGGICGIIGAVLVLALVDTFTMCKKTTPTGIAGMSFIFPCIVCMLHDTISYFLKVNRNIAYIGHFGGYASGIVTAILILCVKYVWSKTTERFASNVQNDNSNQV